MDLIIRKLLKKRLSDVHANRTSLIYLASIVNIIFNLVFAGVKLFIGILVHSVAVTFDAINNLTDSLGSIVVIIGQRLANKLPTRNHPLGYGRIEYLSGIIVATMVLVVGIDYLIVSYGRILHPQSVKANTLQIAILVVTIFGKIILSRLNLVVGRATDSKALVASGTDALMDVLISSVTVLSVVIASIWHAEIDGIVGTIMALYFVYTGVKLVLDSASSIIGERPDKVLANELKEDILEFEHVMGAYDIVIHNYGPVTRYGTINLEFPDYAKAEDIHKIMIDANKILHGKYGINITFGLYSVNTYNEEVLKLRNAVDEIVETVPYAQSIHAFHLDQLSKEVRFDVVVSFGIKDYDEFRRGLNEKLETRIPGYIFEYKIDLEYSD
jgi:cation diffusion facilitator family transporter